MVLFYFLLNVMLAGRGSGVECHSQGREDSEGLESPLCQDFHHQGRGRHCPVSGEGASIEELQGGPSSVGAPGGENPEYEGDGSGSRDA